MSKKIGIRVEASDHEPGAIVLVIVVGEEEQALPPMKGQALQDFCEQLSRAVATANEHVLPFMPARVEQFQKQTKELKP